MQSVPDRAEFTAVDDARSPSPGPGVAARPPSYVPAPQCLDPTALSWRPVVWSCRSAAADRHCSLSCCWSIAPRRRCWRCFGYSTRRNRRCKRSHWSCPPCSRRTVDKAADMDWDTDSAADTDSGIDLAADTGSGSGTGTRSHNDASSDMHSGPDLGSPPRSGSGSSCRCNFPRRLC